MQLIQKNKKTQETPPLHNTFILPKTPVRQSDDFACHKAHPPCVNTRKSLDSVNKSQPLLAVRFLHFFFFSSFQIVEEHRQTLSLLHTVNEGSYHWGRIFYQRAGHNEASRRSLGFSPSILEQWLAHNRQAELHHINILHSGCSAAQCPPRSMYSSVLHQLCSLTSGRLGGLC